MIALALGGGTVGLRQDGGDLVGFKISNFTLCGPLNRDPKHLAALSRY
jgi:hypothetical protein